MWHSDYERKKEEKWKLHDLKTSTKKTSLIEECCSCKKTTKHWITYNSYVNYWKEIIKRKSIVGDRDGKDLKDGKYECLDCHNFLTDFYFEKDDFELNLKNAIIKKI